MLPTGKKWCKSEWVNCSEGVNCGFSWAAKGRGQNGLVVSKLDQRG